MCTDEALSFYTGTAILLGNEYYHVDTWKRGQTKWSAPPFTGYRLCCFSLAPSIATDLAVIDFGKVIEQATKFHLYKFTPDKTFLLWPKTHDRVPIEWQEGCPVIIRWVVKKNSRDILQCHYYSTKASLKIFQNT